MIDFIANIPEETISIALALLASLTTGYVLGIMHADKATQSDFEMLETLVELSERNEDFKKVLETYRSLPPNAKPKFLRLLRLTNRAVRLDRYINSE